MKWTLRVKYVTCSHVEDSRQFKDRDEFVEWLYRQLFIEPVTIIDIEEILY